jgi:hypothetical protein
MTNSGLGSPRHQNLEDRVTRAKSWLDAASRLEEGPEHIQIQVAFIYRNIAFNALYGRRQYENRTETSNDLRELFDRIVALHGEDKRAGGSILPDALQRSRGFWEQVIEDEFVYNWYYKQESLNPGFKNWYMKHRFEACERWKVGEYRNLLLEIFHRVMVLRNQIFHGCATFGQESKGWKSVQKATPVTRELIPALYQLMMQYGDQVKWPPLPYPRRGSVQHPHRPRGE